MFVIPMSTMQMMTYIQTQTLLMYRQTIVNVKQKCKAVKERKQICGVASCHAWIASQEAHLFNVVCPTHHFVSRREITRFFKIYSPLVSSSLEFNILGGASSFYKF